MDSMEAVSLGHASDMFQRIISSPSAFFKHQQRSEPDLIDSEKLAILQDLFIKNPATFLSRYQEFLVAEDLENFKWINSKSLLNSEYLIAEIAKRSDKHAQSSNVSSPALAKRSKNRRYIALQQLIDGKEFFSDWEMRNREPLLYDQMIGQYQTSEESKVALHAEGGSHFGEKLSSVFMDFYESKNAEDERNRQQEEEDREGVFDGNFSSVSAPFSKPMRGTVKQMREMRLEKKRTAGRTTESSDESEMEDEEEEDEDSQRRPYISIPREEKDRLRAEFTAYMHERFLTGGDSDVFDYSTVDNNPEYDSLELMDRDAEDSYFDSEEPS